nr:hypothetical protein [Tanacetum cinerariifolium]
MTTSSAINSVFRGFFEKQKLTGPNFIDWYRQLRIVLSIKDKLNYLEQHIPPAPEEGQSVSSYVLKMNGYIDNQERLGHPVTLGLGVSLILIGLRKEYDGFVQNYNMPSMGKTVNELHAMLKLHEQTLPKNNAPTLNAIRAVFSRVAEEEKNASSGAGGSGIFVIELNTILNRPWIYDIICGTYICNTTHGLRASRKLKPRALSLYVGNGQREAVEAIGAFYLCLPGGLEIVLNNCHYASSITKGVIFVSRLYEYGFVNRFIDNTIQVSMNNMVYFSAIPRDGIFDIDLSNSLTNESSIYAVSNKRAKLDLDSSHLWHCRLGHISKKHIEKLQHDGLLDSSDLRAFEKYVSCMSRKMARIPYTHQVERAKDLYLLFQKEVENQLGKTIKSLCSNHGGEYMIQEFLDHLKDHGIIVHRTPPYTPQHNGVLERRNRTLLDMIRSMMSQTTLPKSFWDYALEIDVRILNMAPTKKVEKTPYEVWHGKAPRLSCLKVWGCEALVKRDTLTKLEKLKPRSIKCIVNSLINQEASGSLEDLEIIQKEDTHLFIDTSLNHEEDDLEIDEPQSDIVPIRRSTRTRHALDRMCLYIDVEEHELGDLDEPTNYKAALLDLESEKWVNAMNVEMQSIKENQVWIFLCFL